MLPAQPAWESRWTLKDVRALMGRYYEHAREVIGSYGGTLEKFIGDAVMAVFGLPVAHGDDAERALALCWSAWKTDSSCANFTRLRNCFSQSNPPARKVRTFLRDCTLRAVASRYTSHRHVHPACVSAFFSL